MICAHNYYLLLVVSYMIVQSAISNTIKTGVTQTDGKV